MKKLLVLFSLICSLNANSQQGFLKVEDIWGSRKLFANAVNGLTSMKDGAYYTDLLDNEQGTYLLKYSFASGKVVDTIFAPNHLIYNDDTIAIHDYTFNQNENGVLISCNSEQLYRHSVKSDFYYLDLKSKELKYLTPKGKVMYCSLSPSGNNVAYVRDNNLYITNIASGIEKAITTDGSKNAIINGATDWVYEEEFSMDVAFQWSPDGQKIAYYKFDESRVKEFNLTTYGGLYPKEEKYKYPKAGEENSIVSIHLYQLDGTTVEIFKTNSEIEYIPRIKWTNNSAVLSYQTLNRHQNVLHLMFYNTASKLSQSVLNETNNSFIEITDDLYFLKNGKQFIWSSSQSGYNQLYLYDLNGKLIKQITSRAADITRFYGYDEKSGLFYYQSAAPTPMERSIIATNLNGKMQLLTKASGTHQANFNADFTYFVDTYSAYGQPYKCSVLNAKGQSIRILEDNAKLNNSLSTYKLAKIEQIQFESKHHDILNGWMIKPPDFDSTLKYPVLLYVYGGPGKQTVLNQWEGPNYLWHQMLAQRGYIIISVDNRGTPGRGLEFANCIYKNMGDAAFLDQMSTLSYIKSKSYVDGNRIGVWGWSFGGYLTSLLMTKSTQEFKLGIAVAPVTNWRFYDNIYTERYLQTPQENPTGYDKNSPITYAHQLNGKFLLIHGSTDDNVHMQNSMDFVNAMIKANKPFDYFVYPNRNHSIGAGARLHLYNKMTDYIIYNL